VAPMVPPISKYKYKINLRMTALSNCCAWNITSSQLSVWVALEYLFLFDHEKAQNPKPQNKEGSRWSSQSVYEVKKHDPITGAKWFSQRVEFPCMYQPTNDKNDAFYAIHHMR
jgi:hypothetical protein